MKYLQYTIVTFEDASQLTIKVNRLIKIGWQPIGGAFVIHNQFYGQSMGLPVDQWINQNGLKAYEKKFSHLNLKNPGKLYDEAKKGNS